MLFVTAANRRYKTIAQHSLEQLKLLHYKAVCYDLGDLGFGIKHEVANHDFQQTGVYKIVDGWASRALHKPAIILHAMLRAKGEVIVYLDADAICYAPIQEILDYNYDIGVTSRQPREFGRTPQKRAFLGQFNAGVLFLKPTSAVQQFLRDWQNATEQGSNDQRALNELLNPANRHIQAGEEFSVGGLSVHVFDGSVYNAFKPVSARAKIIHYRAETWRKRLTIPTYRRRETNANDQRHDVEKDVPG